MTIRVYFRNELGNIEELTDALAVETLEVSENAEEGSVAISRVTLDDPDMALDIGGHRLFFIEEDEVYGEEPKIFRGYTADRTYSRGQHPLGREIQVQVADMNIVWQRRVMVGADCKRPAETDVARMQWLVTTAEAGLIDDDTYLSTDGPVNMDACDYRGQMMGSVADDCAQASGKNWYVTHDNVAGLGPMIWYGHQALEVYDSPLRLCNDRAEVDNVTTFAISDDTTLTRDPSRVFSGVYLPFERGAVYRQDDDTAIAFAKRDVVMPSLNVKSKTKAIARAVRYLADLDEETDRVTTAVILPAPQVNDVRPGMRVQFAATHFPGYQTWRWLRVLQRTVKYWVPGEYLVTLVLDGPGVSALPPPPPCGLPEEDAFHNFSDNPYVNIFVSNLSGPTFEITDGGVYRLVIRVNDIYRAAPECFATMYASVRTDVNVTVTALTTPDPPPAGGHWWQSYDQFGASTYYSVWYQIDKIIQAPVTGWIETAIGGSGGPVSCNWDIWVECQ